MIMNKNFLSNIAYNLYTKAILIFYRLMYIALYVLIYTAKVFIHSVVKREIKY